MATEEEIVEILLQSSGQEDLEEAARKTVKTWQDAFRLIEDAYPDPIDAIDNIVNDINQVKDAIAQGFQVDGVDWSSLFDDMEDIFKDSIGAIDISDWWDSILQAMLASGIDSQYIDQFVQDFESQLRDALGDIEIDPPDIDFTDTQQQLRDLISLFSGMDTIGLGNLFDIQSVEEFSNAIAGLHDINLNYVNRTLDELAARVGNMNIDDIVKDETIARLKEFQETINQIRFDPTEDAINQIQQVMNDLGQNFQLDLGNIFDFNGIDDLREAISNLSENELRQLYDYLDQAADRIQHLNIDEAIKEGTVTQLREYLDLIRQLNEESEKTSNEGGTKITQFLDRYKYSLALVGGALAGIMGMMRYSTTFGTALDVIGQAVGYLADVIMYPLLPYVMLLAEWIIGLADWFNALPDPIKAIVTGIFMLIGAFALLKALGIVGFLKSILEWMWALAGGATAAGTLTGTGYALGILAGLAIGFAAVYLLMQSGALHAVSLFGQSLMEQNPLIVDAIAVLLAPLALLGVIINDMTSGQFDKIPEHMNTALKMTANYFVAFGARILGAVTGLIGPQIAWIMERFASLGVIGGGLVKTFGDVGDAIFDAFAGAAEKALGFFEVIARGGEYLGLFKGLGDTIKDLRTKFDAAKDGGNDWQKSGEYIIDFWTRFGENSDENVNLAISKWKELAETFEGYNYDAMKENLGEFNPGSILNGFTSEDQIKAQLKKLLPSASDLEIDEITNKYDNWLGGTDYQKAADDIDTTKNALQELNKEFAAGKITADEYQKKINSVTQELSGVSAASQASQGATKQALKSGDMFPTDDRDTPGSISVNEMMKSRYDKMMHDYTTQSKYKNDAYLNPVSQVTKGIQAQQIDTLNYGVNVQQDNPSVTNQPQPKVQLPAGPAPVSNSSSSQSTTNITNNENHTHNYQISSLDYRKIADEVAKIWDSRSRGSRI